MGMGTLIHLASGRRMPLRAIHVVGRAPSNDLQLPAREVSAHHAALRWNGQRWTLRDLGSRNGTWIDGVRIPTGEEVSVQSEVGLGFGAPGVLFRVIDIGPPEAAAFPVGGGDPVMIEDGLIFLPDAEEPELCLHLDADGAWVSDDPEQRRGLRDGDVVEVGGQRWQLHLPEPVLATETSPTSEFLLQRVQLRFEVSWDEEHVRLVLVTPAGERDLGGRAHNYMLLTLARRRLADAASGRLPESEQGWVYADELSRMLGIDANVIYLHTCRVRKQLSKYGLADAFDVIERRQGSGQIRIGVTDLAIVTLGATQDGAARRGV